MNILEEMRKSGKKTKALTEFTSNLILKNNPSSGEFTHALANGNDSERGTCIEALEYATQKRPEMIKPYLTDVIACLSDKAPRVKWEAARILGNIANSLPSSSEKALKQLMVNTTDKGTVVRWSTAYALGEILKNNRSLRPALLLEIKKILGKEQNNGVKNVYLKAIKALEK